MTDRDHCAEEDYEQAAESDSQRLSGSRTGRWVPADWLIDSGAGPHQDREMGENK